MYKDISEKLWSIIDDIDTMSDVIKPSDLTGYKLFYDAVMKKQKERHKYMYSKDGYNLVVNENYRTTDIMRLRLQATFAQTLRKVKTFLLSRFA